MRYSARCYSVFIVRHSAQNVKLKNVEKVMNNHQLSKNADAVQQVLLQAGLSCKVLELPTSTRTATDAASSIGCEVSQIAKSLIFKTKETSKPVLVLASGPNRVDEKIIENYAGEGIIKADADFVKNVTGFAIGGIPPVGHKNKIELIFIDKDLMNYDEVWAAAGTPNSVFCIKSNDLLIISKGLVIPICR